jgi:PhnB protein
MHARLEAEGALIIASDGHPNYPAKVGENMGVALGSTDKDRVTKIFNGLAAGGRVKMPLAKQPGGGEVGWLSDKFGITWDGQYREALVGGLFCLGPGADP